MLLKIYLLMEQALKFDVLDEIDNMMENTSCTQNFKFFYDLFVEIWYSWWNCLWIFKIVYKLEIWRSFSWNIMFTWSIKFDVILWYYWSMKFDVIFWCNFWCSWNQKSYVSLRLNFLNFFIVVESLCTFWLHFLKDL